MHVLEITDPRRFDREKKPLVWMEWISEASTAALRVHELKAAGRTVKLKYSRQW